MLQEIGPVAKLSAPEGNLPTPEAPSRRTWLPLSISAAPIARSLLVTLVLYLLIGPLAILAFTSFRNTSVTLPFSPGSSFTFSNYSAILSSLATYKIMGTTLLYAAGSVALSLAIVVGLAYVLERTDFPMRRMATAAVMASLGLPPFVIALSWILLANPTNGVLNTVIRDAFGSSAEGPLNISTLVGMVFVTAVVLVPSMYLMVSGTFSRLDPRLEEASTASGVGDHRTLRRISLPLLTPAILGAVIYFAVLGIEIFTVPAFVGLPGHINVLSTEIYGLANPSGEVPNYGPDCVFGLMAVAVALCLVVGYRTVIRRSSRYETVMGKAFTARQVVLSRRAKIGIGIGILLYATLGVILPMITLIWQSVTQQLSAFGSAALKHLTWAYYVQVVKDPVMRGAMIHTVIVAFVSALSVMTIATLVAWLSLRRPSPLTRAMEMVIFASLGIPGVVLALAILLIYIWLSIGVFGTIWILVIAMVTRYLSYGLVVMRGALGQIGRELEDASTASGVGDVGTLRRVVLPIVWPSVIRGFLWTFIQVARTVTIVLVLISISNLTIGSELWGVWFDNGNYAYAAAASVILACVTGVLTYVVVRLDPMIRGAST